MAEWTERLPGRILIGVGAAFDFHAGLVPSAPEKFQRAGLEWFYRLCTEPKRAVDAFPALFKSRIDHKNLIMATGEAIAHLNYLQNVDRMNVERDANGVDWYCSKE